MADVVIYRSITTEAPSFITTAIASDSVARSCHITLDTQSIYHLTNHKKYRIKKNKNVRDTFCLVRIEKRDRQKTKKNKFGLLKMSPIPACSWPAGAHLCLAVCPQLWSDNIAMGCFDISLTLLSCLPRQGFQASEAGAWSPRPSPAELRQC